jgi:type IV pilus assembly protein PilE
MKAASKGFTLIEMMMVVVIIGILAAIAIPSYIDYQRRGALSSPLAELSSGKVRMEQFFMDHRTYNTGKVADDICTIGFKGAKARDFDIDCAITKTGFKLTATGNAGTIVNNFVYTIDETNTKQTTKVHANWTKSVTSRWGALPAPCWVLKKDGSC